MVDVGKYTIHGFYGSIVASGVRSPNIGLGPFHEAKLHHRKLGSLEIDER